MVHKLALGIGAATAVAVLLAAMGVGGLAARPVRAQDPVIASAPAAAPVTQTQVDTVYVKPVPKAKVVHVTKTVKPTPTKSPRVVVVRVHRPSGDDGNERDEGGDGNERDGGD